MTNFVGTQAPAQKLNDNETKRYLTYLTQLHFLASCMVILK